MRFGHGVKISDLKLIQKRIKKDHQPAFDLYDTGNYDAFALQPVPEPSTVVLGLVGVLGIAAYSKRRNNKKNSDTNTAA